MIIYTEIKIIVYHIICRFRFYRLLLCRFTLLLQRLQTKLQIILVNLIQAEKIL